MFVKRIAHHSARRALLAAALLAAGCASQGVAFRALEPRVSPYAEVTLEIDFKNRVIRAVPDMVIIWFESKNPLSEILWTARCVEGEGMEMDDLVCPEGATVVIRPKPGCSKTLFGATRNAPAGEIHIRSPHNAVPSGKPNVEEAESLMAAQAKTTVLCDGSDKKSHGEMVLTQSVHDIYWGYEVEARRPGDEPFLVDPAAWIEKDN